MSVRHVSRRILAKPCSSISSKNLCSPFLSPGRARCQSTAAEEEQAEEGNAQGMLVQKRHSDRIQFPGAVNTKFTDSLDFSDPSTQPAMPTFRIMNPDGKIINADYTASISDELLLKMYMDMLTISVMDPIFNQLQRQGRLSFYMQSDGEEGIAVGSASALTAEDVVFSQYREVGVFIARGFTLKDICNQLTANRLDAGKGRNMPVHYGSKDLNMHTISSPLATQIPQAAGAAYALKLQHLQNPTQVPKRVVACYFGEGAASEGDFHGALNIAATRKCPVVFVCRNNGYAISTPSIEQYCGDGIASRGVGYGIHTIRVDGNDTLAVLEVMKKARELALSGDMRPVLVEAMSYRVSHHSTSDDSSRYRAKAEVEQWRRRDSPIVRLRKYMELKGLWSQEKEQEAIDRIKTEVKTTLKNAEKEKKPPLRAMFEDVYEEITEEQTDQIRTLKDIVRRYPGEYDVQDFDGGLDGLDERKA